jgi:hypothetical protein
MGAMSALLDRIARIPTAGSGERTPAPVQAGAVAAVQAAAASLVFLLAPVVACWVISGSRATWFQAVQVGLDAWLLVQHTGIAVPGGHVGLLPLGLAPLPLVACWLASRRMAQVLDPRAAAIEIGVTRARPAQPPMLALGSFVASYALLGLLASLVAATPQARPLATQAVLGCAVTATAGGIAGSAAYRAGGALAGIRALWQMLRPRPQAGRWLRLGGLALAGLLSAAAVLTLIAVTVGAQREVALHEALDPGVSGTAVLAALQLALLPNVMVWVAAFLAGPGFALGAGTTVDPHQTVLGPLPALPVLGALPQPGPQPHWMTTLVLVPVLAGVVAGAAAVRTRPHALPMELTADCAGLAAVAGAGFLLLAWLSGGPAGPGRLDVIGPVPWLAGIALAGECLAGALLAVAVGLAWRAVARRWAGRRAEASATDP